MQLHFNPKPQSLTLPSGPYPFGMVMQGRSFSLQTRYRYGFNTQEKDLELGQDIYTAEFWEYDAKLGRRWNLDPKLSNTISKYLVFDNSPVYKNDINGDIFIVSTTDKVASDDVNSLAKKRNRKYITTDLDGKVNLNFTGLKQKKIDKLLAKDKGLDLINKLATAKGTNGVDITFFYGTEGETNIELENPEKQTNVQTDYYKNVSDLSTKGKPIYESEKLTGYDPRAFVLNSSTSKYANNGSQFGLKPADKYNSKVYIAQGEFYKWGTETQAVYDNNQRVTGFNKVHTLLFVSRTDVVFHELMEAYLRTALNMCYDEAHSKAGGEGDVSLFVPTN